MGRGRWRWGLVAAALLTCGTQAAAAGLPPVLTGLERELGRFRYCDDEIRDGRADWWGFWWSLPERGCGDCEDFAAFSYATLRARGVPAGDIRLVAADLGPRLLADGKPARVLHLWLEAKIAGRTWTIWNGQVRAGAWRERALLSSAEVASLVDDRFGPNWPYGLAVD